MGKVKKASREEKVKVKEILGKKSRYIGLGGQTFECDCGRSFKKGMVSEYQGKMFCSEGCVESSLR